MRSRTMPGNQYFILPQQPDPNDRRPRNALWVLTRLREGGVSVLPKAGQTGCQGEDQEEADEAEGDVICRQDFNHNYTEDTIMGLTIHYSLKSKLTDDKQV